jgi:membrane fusion protein, type I secretion system
MIAKKDSSRLSIRLHLLFGAIVVAFLVGGLARWAWTTELAGAVVATGTVVVDSNVKQIQHPTGGVVGAINVRDDDYVKAGDVLIHLDDTQTKANVAVFSRSLDELDARQARLEAEKDAADTIDFPEDLLARESIDPEVAHILAGERKLFNLRVEARKGQKAQLRERAAQLAEEVKGLVEQVDAKSQEIGLIEQELKGVMDLWEKKLVPFTRVTALKRDAARLDGERGELVASKASAGGKIAEVQLQIIQVDDDARSKVAEELSDVRAKIGELSERKIAAEDQLRRVDIRSPQSGRVHELTVHTIGRVISPGETIMLIVPDSDALSVEAKVAPNDIDQLHVGQSVVLRFSAFNMRTTPEINGNVQWIAPDVTEDKKSGAAYYVMRITVPTTELAHLKGLKVVPGMPVEAFVQTGTRTALSYFLKPLTDQVMRTFRTG